LPSSLVLLLLSLASLLAVPAFQAAQPLAALLLLPLILGQLLLCMLLLQQATAAA
jgi:hypothetical protein